MAQVVKNLPANEGHTGSISGSGRFPGGGNGNAQEYSFLENSHGQRSQADYIQRAKIPHASWPKHQT